MPQEMRLSNFVDDKGTLGDETIIGGPVTPNSVLIDYSIMGLIRCLYQKEIASTTADGLFPLTANSGIYPETGLNTTSGKYCRTNFLYIANRVAILGLNEYEWCSWSYSTQNWGSQTHSNTMKKYLSGMTPIFISPVEGDARFCVSFRRVDGAALTTDTSDPTSDFSKIRNAFKLFECSFLSDQT